MSPSIAPLDVRTLDNGELLVTWTDGTRSLYHPMRLRYLCPCAQCVDEVTGKRVLKRESVPENICVKSFKLVGRYALQFEFSDFHSTGIYSFEYLRSSASVPQI